ncbi:MAG: diguanylate phosphodiesterase [Acidimicrobiales bacterium]|nr:diguanylate phosphodiesterase [Acidimicrobiales bacterium]
MTKRARSAGATGSAAKDSDLTAAMSLAIEPNVLMQRVTDRTLELISAADGVMVGLADGVGVTYVFGAGKRTAHVGTRVDLDSSLSGLAVRTGQVLRSDDTQQDPRVDAAACRRLSVVSLVCIPLMREQEAIGVLAVNAARANAFTDGDVATLTGLAEFVSVVVGSARDLRRVSGALLAADQPPRSRDPKSRAAGSLGTAGRYMMNVLRPDDVTRMDSDQRIRDVLDRPEVLSILVQPVVDLTEGRVIAVEALSRFAGLPIRPPDVWFAEARSCGLGIELEILAIRRALAFLPLLPESIALAVNAGPPAAMSPWFAECLSRVAPERIVLELTEHTAVDDYPALIAGLRPLRRRGLRIAIDDTGAGYSSLAHILKMAPDFIKLDRELTTGIELDPVRRALAAALVTFAADTGAQIIAEGIETEDALEVLQDLGVGFGQGYHLGRPAPFTATTDLLARSPLRP